MANNSYLGFIFSVWVLYTSLLYCYYGAHPGEAYAATVTDPQEVIALKVIKEKMKNRKWDFSEDPCSGKGSWNAIHDYQHENYLVCEIYMTEGRMFFHVTRIFLKRQNLTGVVPAELANLTYLQEMDFTCNHLNGPIPKELGFLSNLKNLSLGINHLSGRIPKELGNLTNLRKIDLFSNKLYGRLPRSFANLRQLEILALQSNRLHGKIPKIYGHLHQLKSFVASSNNFSGKIPDFIGNWKNLTILKLEATSLEGPIPSTISYLIQLTDFGFVVGVSFHHSICDGRGAGQFLKGLAEMARGEVKPSLEPVWNRELLKPKDPINLQFYHFETIMESVHSPHQPLLKEDLVQASLFIKNDVIKCIKKYFMEEIKGFKKGSKK